MMYAFLTLGDGTEIVHSEMRSDKTVRVYVEKPNTEHGFLSASCILPQYAWQEVCGFTSQYISLYEEVIRSTAHLILRFSQEGGIGNLKSKRGGPNKWNAPKTVDYYLEQGCSRPMAQYYASGRKTIVGVVANDDFTLMLTFDNGEVRRLDMKPYLRPETIFEPFMKLQNFRRVYFDETHSVCWDIDPNIDSKEVWSNKVDICPDVCYVDSIPVNG